MRVSGTRHVVAFFVLLAVIVGGMLALYHDSDPDAAPPVEEGAAPLPEPADEPALPPDLPADESPGKATGPQGKADGYVRGRVTDRIGTPVEGARIAVLDPQRDWRLMVRIAATTDGDGRFSADIGKYRPGEEARIVVDAVDQGYVLAERLLVPEYYGGEVEISFRLEHGRSIAGVVTGPKGEPIAGAEVHLQEIYVGEEVLRRPSEGRVKTDGEGRFTDDAFRPGIYRIVVQGSCSGHRFAVVKEGVAAGETDVAIRFRGFGARHFSFRDEGTGKPLKLAQGSLEFIYGHTGTEEELATWEEFENLGEVRFTHLPEGHYRLSLSHPGYEEVLTDLFFIEAGKDLGEICYGLTSLSR